MIWHYPSANINHNDEEDTSGKQEMQYEDYNINSKRYSKLSPSIFVIDFDNTLAVYDKNIQLDDHKTFASVYTRPYMYEFLQYLKKINKHNTIILWTRGEKRYIQKSVLLLDMANYFNHILSRDDCRTSKKKYGCYKSFRYIKDLFPTYSNMRSFLIDDKADENGDYYFQLITVKPFIINDIFIGTDSTLLNLMLYLDKEYFSEKEKLVYNVICCKDDKMILKRKLDINDCQLLTQSK